MDPILVQTRVETVMLKRIHRSGLRALRGFHQNYTPSVNQALKSSQTVMSNLDHWTSFSCMSQETRTLKSLKNESICSIYVYRFQMAKQYTQCTFGGILCSLVMLIPSFSNMCKTECHRYCMGVICGRWKRAHGQEIIILACSCFPVRSDFHANSSKVCAAVTGCLGVWFQLLGWVPQLLGGIFNQQTPWYNTLYISVRFCYFWYKVALHKVRNSRFFMDFLKIGTVPMATSNLHAQSGWLCKTECHRYCMVVIWWGWERDHGQEISIWHVHVFQFGNIFTLVLQRCVLLLLDDLGWDSGCSAGFLSFYMFLMAMF